MKAFISHDFEDKPLYDALCVMLDRAGIDRTDSLLVAAEQLAPQLQEKIEDCDMCVFIVTPRSLKSSWCHAEVGAFWGAGKKVVVYIAEKVNESDIPPQFKGDVWATDEEAVIRAIRAPSGFHADLTGIWECRWDILSVTVSGKSGADDRVTIKGVAGDHITAQGRNCVWGDFPLRGRISKSNLVTFVYEGTKEKKHLGGVVLLRLNVTRDAMFGYLHEYTKDERFIWGETRWQKS